MYLDFQDALTGYECDYALVDDALPLGKIHRIQSTSRRNEKGMHTGARFSLLGDTSCGKAPPWFVFQLGNEGL